jgi:N-acetylglucosamine-6-phosphate deacetylase
MVAVSDASPLAGTDEGTSMEWLGTTIEVKDGCARTADGTLAGSAVLLGDTLGALADAGLTAAEAIIALGAAPRAVLAPERSMGMVPGDRVWIAGLPSVHLAANG